MSNPSQSASTAEEQTAYWFLNTLIIFVADLTASEGAFSIYRQVAPLGFATPYHTHAAYGEAFYVLQGEVTFFCDGVKTVLRDGGCIYMPGSLPHGFRVSGEGAATMMIVSPPEGTFGAFVKEMGEPASSHELPVPSPPDFARLGAVSAKYGSTMVGPLPD
jgi:mannose-6-phosphate isomerase-like protein (cupin superfamily)